ncbi:RNA polymerase sigma factor [Empedobacter brevis]|uniref:RNA polymerase sigma factor n=1 Tax=Empedobacter brevis TaxID=247 RepID=UPI00123DE337|nr:RNA polymerase sigma factor [Empedobacter brevis]QES91321.1 RNA polymerase sigma factor [Empedobacter brevis]
MLNVDKTKFSDQALLNLCISGSELGYSQFYHRFSKSVFNTIFRLITNLSEAEDLTQEIFISVFSDLQKLKNIENIGAWLNRVAINKSISLLRKKKIYFSDIENVSIMDESEEQLNEKQNWDNKVDEILLAIDSLPIETRTIVNLYLFENIPHEEIANLLGISHTTVRSKYHRAKKKISELMQQTTLS